MSDPGEAAGLVDRERYPVGDLSSARTQRIIARQQPSLAEKGVALLPGFATAAAVTQMAEDALAWQRSAHLEDVWGTPYLEAPDVAFPSDHPRRALEHSLTWVIAYDLIPRTAAVRVLYEWEPLRDFIGAILERRPLYRMADPLGALNVTIMDAGHQQGWHYDNTEFVVSLALQSSRAGGMFECAPFIRSAGDERYDAVAAVLRGQARGRVEILPMTPGTLMIFAGRRSLHRVTAVEGDVPRLVALLAYDTRPDTDSSELFKFLRYGRATPQVHDG